MKCDLCYCYCFFVIFYSNYYMVQDMPEHPVGLLHAQGCGGGGRCVGGSGGGGQRHEQWQLQQQLLQGTHMIMQGGNCASVPLHVVCECLGPVDHRQG
mgnify:CR=1 FL=1